jgi:hypothetical protein
MENFGDLVGLGGPAPSHDVPVALMAFSIIELETDGGYCARLIATDVDPTPEIQLVLRLGDTIAKSAPAVEREPHRFE